MAAGVATGGVAALAGGAAYGLYQGGRWLLSGNGGDAASSSGGEFQDIRTLNNAAGHAAGALQRAAAASSREVEW